VNTSTHQAFQGEQRDLVRGFTPFPHDRADEYRRAGYWQGRRLDGILRDAARQWPDKPAVIDATGGLTLGELDALADRVAGALAARGIRPGDRMLLQLPNSKEFAVAAFALLRAGAVPVLCLPGHRSAELGHFAEVSGAVGLIIPDVAAGFDYRDMATQLVEANPDLRHVLVLGDQGPFESWSELRNGPDTTPPAFDVDTTEPAVLLVSGGTTGLPKLIPRTHDDYVYNTTASAQACGLVHDDVYLVVLPAGHNFPFACPGLLGSITVGATTVFTDDPSPESAFALIDRYGVTVTALVNALAKLWTQACEWEPVLPTSLRLVQVGGSRLSPEEARYIYDGLTTGLQQIFGMAEGMLQFTRPGDPVEVVANTQGRPVSPHDELRIVDENGVEVAPGEEGELLVRGPYTINGYYRADEANARSFTPDGFYRSGDRVRIFADGPRAGNIEVVGRIKDVIHRGGETVSASDLEDHLLTHPAVYAVAAVALPDDYLGEKICAAIVFRGAPVGLADLNAFLDERGASKHARPDVLVPMPSLPMTAVGKVDKKKVVAAITG
jgi:mycobactin salicyl-AMP ligase